MTQIRGFKLTSGEEIVCQYHKTDNLSFIVEHPLTVEWEVNANMAMTYDILPWTFSCEIGQTMSIPVFSVCAGPYMIRDDIRDNYKLAYDRACTSQEMSKAARNQIDALSSTRTRRRKY